MLSETLKSLRKAKKMNQATLAEELKVSQATIASWESGKRQPDLETLSNIADFFNVSTDYLLGRAPMTIEVKKETPPPISDDEIQLSFHLSDAPKDENELENLIRGMVKSEIQKEFAKRGL